MKIKQLYIYCILLGSFLLTGCEMADEYTTNPRANFEALWKIIDEHYCFLDYKNIDWKDVHTRYSAQLYDGMTQYDLFDLMAMMLNELKDGHTNLISSFNVSRYGAWYEDFPPNFSYEVQCYYMGEDYLRADNVKYRKLSGIPVGYIYCNSFSDAVSEKNMDQMFLNLKDCRGLIIDVRNNGGGLLTNSDRFVSRFIERRILTGYIQHKTGPGHTEFSTPYPSYLEPSNRTRWLLPVVVLTNRHCFSAANDFVQKMRMFPQVTVIGDRTGGGSGFPFSAELPNGWGVRFSAGLMLDPNKQCTEFGIDPDIHVSLSANDERQGKDTLIESAIRLLLAID